MMSFHKIVLVLDIRPNKREFSKKIAKNGAILNIVRNISSLTMHNLGYLSFDKRYTIDFRQQNLMVYE